MFVVIPLPSLSELVYEAITYVQNLDWAKVCITISVIGPAVCHS